MNMNTQNQNSKQTTIVRGVQRPEWICSDKKQNTVLVRDKSGSMFGEKADDASAASLDLVAELASPSNKDGFNVAVVDFAHRSKVVHSLEKATALNGNVKPLKVGFFGGSTNITAGLEDALSILETAAEKGEKGIVYLRPVVILFSDGCHNEGPEPYAVANELKDRADLVACAFGNDADEELLRSLASTPQHFYRCSTGRELRAFLASVGATMTTTMAAGMNATQALTKIQQ